MGKCGHKNKANFAPDSALSGALAIYWTQGRYFVILSSTINRRISGPHTVHALEKEMATLSSVLAWRIPGMEEPGGLLSMGLHRVGHDWRDLAAAVSVNIKRAIHVKYPVLSLVNNTCLKNTTSDYLCYV